MIALVKQIKLLLVLVVLFVIIILAYSVTNKARVPKVTPPSATERLQGVEPSAQVDVTALPKLDTVIIKLGTRMILAEMPKTADEYETGLGGRVKLDINSGMLFSLGTPDYYEFWMKGMLFPIDIIWMNEGKRVVDISTNVEPNSYPQTFSPRERAMYVLEVPAGYASTSGISIGDKANF